MFNRSLKRVPFRARPRQQRIHFRLGDVKRVDAGDAAPVEVYLHHDVVRLGGRLLKDLFQDVHDELHRRVVVVEDDHAEQRRFLRLALDTFFDASAGLPVRPVAHDHSVTGRVQGSKFKVHGSRFTVPGFKIRVLGSRFDAAAIFEV